MSFKTAFLLCFVFTLVPVHGEKKVSNEEEKTRLPEFLSELDLASLEASEEDIKDLKKVVKRLTPEKNGEYQIYQGVTGQPGVDFPVLTSIPATSFTCRGVKGGYYADLETNCQVFHICDNGRKISFLCPNGTIFQQSQLICDWWFKVDCSRSTELYEQSAELLAEEEKKRTDKKKINSEYHRTSEEENGQNNFQYVDYDGRQNGRSNPFSQTVQNQIQDNQNSKNQPSRQNFEYNQLSNSRQNQFSQDYKLKDLQDLSEGNTNFNQQHQSTIFPNTHQPRHRQQNQLIDDRKEKSKQDPYDHRRGRKYQSSEQGNNQVSRNSKSKSYTENVSFNGIGQKATPSYTETTTFRTTSPSPVKEFQQMAESAAFVNNRGNRFNKVFSSSQYNTYYNNRVTSDGSQKSSEAGPTTVKPKVGSIPPFPGPTFTPIFKPRLASTEKRTTTPRTTTDGFAYNNKNAQNYKQVDRQKSQRAGSEFRQGSTTVPYDSTSNYENPATRNYQDENYTTLRPVTEGYQQNPSTGSQNYQSSGSSQNSGSNKNSVTNKNFGTGSYQNPTTVSHQNYQSSTNQHSGTGNYQSSSNQHSGTGSYQSSSNQQSGTGNYQNPTTASHQNYQTGTYSEAYQNPGTQKTASYQNYPTSQNYATDQNYGNNANSVTNSNSVPNQNYQNSGNSANQNFSPSGASKNFTRNSYSDNTVTPSGTVLTQQPQGFSNYRQEQRNEIKNPSSQVYQLNSIINAATEKPFNENTSKYDSNRQGKASSTTRPYVPFTKNYAYSTSSTTQKPTYTATVPDSNYHGSLNDLVPKTDSFSPSRSGTGATYLPKKTTANLSSVTRKPILEDRPKTERDHVIEMIQSLEGLDAENRNGNRSGLDIPSSSGPSTLHSLALYFATAGDNVANVTESQNLELRNSKNGNISVELPTSILTQHTISSYIDLFNLNNALENNTALLLDDTSGELDESFEDDLDIQQSEGPLNAAKKSNSTKLRELAQVFTHALSAYLQDPETFKKVLTEIRPTEPSLSGEDEAENTLSPTTTEEYPSVTKEKDEVLDFSDDTNTARRRRPTTPYPTNFESNQDGSTDYYTTSVTSSVSQYSTTPYGETIQDQGRNGLDQDAGKGETDRGQTDQGRTEYAQNGGNNFAFQVNQVLQENRNFNDDSNNSLNDYENYFPAEYKKEKFQNGSREAYGKNLKPSGATPITNYVPSTTTASFFQTEEQRGFYDQTRSLPLQTLQQELTPPVLPENNSPNSNQRLENSNQLIENSNRVQSSNQRFENSNQNLISSNQNLIPSNQNSIPSTTEPFRIRYYDTSANQENKETLVTATNLHSSYRNELTDNKIRPNGRSNSFNTKEPVYTTTETTDHWTSSPEVTHLWETTVFLDPQRINHDLTHDQVSTSGPRLADPTHFTSNPSQELLATDSTSGVTQQNFLDSSTPWQWSSNDNDSPTTFTLLPTAYSTENTATPNPTTVTSIPNLVINVTENEIEKAQEMFGKLNVSSSNTLMKVMKQADNNVTVRQLVLLLISHCNGPMNKTMEEEKEHLLNALLKLPVNEFTSQESHEIIAGISKLNLPLGSVGRVDQLKLKTFTAVTEPSITTFRNRQGRKFKSTTPVPDTEYHSSSSRSIAESRSSALVEDETAISDNRALELLRSLYSIAAKWG